MAAAPHHPIVDLALDLHSTMPHVAAIDILDHAMSGHHGALPGFRNEGPTARLYADHLHPPAPFAELLRRALAPHLDPRELMLIALREPLGDPDLSQRRQKATVQWQLVLDQFAARYHLWHGEAAA